MSNTVAVLVLQRKRNYLTWEMLVMLFLAFPGIYRSQPLIWGACVDVTLWQYLFCVREVLSSAFPPPPPNATFTSQNDYVR